MMMLVVFGAPKHQMTLGLTSSKVRIVNGQALQKATENRAESDDQMTLRITRTLVTFARPFWLEEMGELQSAGTYAVQTDEEQIEGLSFIAYRRVATTITLPLKAAPTGSFQIVTIDPAALEAALRRDG